MGGGVRFLFFSFGGKKGETVKTTSEDTKGLSISFKVKTVDIRRPWMDTALLDYTCLTLADASAGQWSDGKMQASTSQSFPLLPTAMVLATDIQVTATQFSSHTKDVFEEFSAGGRGRVRGEYDALLFIAGSYSPFPNLDDCGPSKIG